jgi:hypothetical protein
MYEVIKMVRNGHIGSNFKRLYAKSVGMLYTKNMEQISERLKFLIPSLTADLVRYSQKICKTPMSLLFELDWFLTFRDSL